MAESRNLLDIPPEIVDHIQGFLSTYDVFNTRFLSPIWRDQATVRHLKKRLSDRTFVFRSLADYTDYNKTFLSPERSPHTSFSFYAQHFESQFLQVRHSVIPPVWSFIVRFLSNIKNIDIYITPTYNRLPLSLPFAKQLEKLTICAFRPSVHFMVDRDLQVLSGPAQENQQIIGPNSPYLSSLKILSFDVYIKHEMSEGFCSFLSLNAPHLNSITFPTANLNTLEELRELYAPFFSVFDLKDQILFTNLIFVSMNDLVVNKLFEWQNSKNFVLKVLGISVLKFSKPEESLKIFSDLLQLTKDTLEELHLGSRDRRSDTELFPASPRTRYNFFSECSLTFQNLKKFTYSSPSCGFTINDRISTRQLPFLQDVDLSNSTIPTRQLKTFIEKSDMCPLVVRLAIAYTESLNEVVFFVYLLCAKFPNLKKFIYHLTSNLAYPFDTLQHIWAYWRTTLEELEIILYSINYTPNVPFIIDQLITGIYEGMPIIMTPDGIHFNPAYIGPSINSHSALERFKLGGVGCITEVAVFLSFLDMKKLHYLEYCPTKYPNVFQFSDRAVAAIAEHGKKIQVDKE